MRSYVTRCLDEQGETRDTLRSAVTDFADKAHRRRSKDAGSAHYLVKPMDLNELLTILTTRAGSKDTKNASAANTI
jgi:hypothetical protein